ncbi:MAG: 6-bladed beta-propeller, partial [Marinifilaceae bacterium]|nr:6-bladed beta-propeller [Marinifilaceae bacterium]
MKHFSFILLFISFLFPNLDSDKIDQKMLTIDLGAALENPKKTNLFSEAHYIKLESNPDILLGGNLYFETHDDKIYILDRQDQKAVLEFNNKGKFIRKIGWTGGGPEEYQNAVDFLVRKDTVDILVSSYPNSVIYSYLNTGAFIGKKTLPYPAYSFQMVENNYAISTNYNKSASDFHVHLFNNNGEELSKFLPNNSQLDMPAESNCFSICNGETYYFEPFNNKIF